ncbi:glycoside hydrolase family 15 protein [Microdochium trichocladiopsis]|uniref:Glucoamylase n=1 Tax=Microdochium trichocladiopsis TaxID=1682393 RepID=A0A9P8YI55_9PEZI|nr:glycoside hydrolase family 15 protein [Microdochium trichocladiopsis]KAH7040448.1 glycoside hydrolase family 15 protein [Microdochium trichocladiopsis]
MHALSSLLLLGSVAFQHVLARPSVRAGDFDGAILKRSVDDFVAKEEPIALQELLCNIGASGCNAQGANSGLVVASPSRTDPDYWYTWTRDAALVFTAIVDRFSNKYDAGLQQSIQQYIVAQAKLQTVSNPSGSLSDGSGLGEPKYNVDGSAFTGAWGRPQRDGPALRAIAMIGYSKWLVANGYSSTASSAVWPVIKNDLAYVVQYWNKTGFDLWEEVNGSSFFTTAAQHRALVEGSALAKSLGTTCPGCDAIAPQILCFQQSYWTTNLGGYARANINVNTGRQERDANSILASIHSFDPVLGCDAATFQPCSDRALSSHKVVVDSFRSIYSINSGIPTGYAVAVGRYSEDVYYNGNPWYLNTLAAAEQLYDALYVWQTQKSITITSTSLPFFKDIYPSAVVGSYAAGTQTYTDIYNAVFLYGEGFMNVVQKYIQTNGSIAEQFDRNNGQPLSARDLTWSYAAFLTAAARRAGIVPVGWAVPSASSVPSVCSATSQVGSYSAFTAVSFPSGQTPVTTATSATFTKPTVSATGTPTQTGCPVATAVAVTFTVKKATTFGQTVKIVGSSANLGSWDPTKAVALSANQYTSSNPIWSGTLNLSAGQSFQYKYIVVNTDGTVTWEADPNRSYTAPASCSSTASRSDTWQ